MPDSRPIQPKLRLKDRRRRLMWVKVASGTAVVAIAVVLAFYMAHLPALTIAEVDVSGTALVPADAVKALAEAELQGSFAFVIPRDNALVAPTASIKKAIADAYPAAAAVSVSRPNLKTLAIAITERTPAALWCPGIPAGEISAEDAATGTPAAANEDCYRMDGKGFIFATATPDMAFVKYFGDVSGGPVGSTYLSGDFASLDGTVAGIASSLQQTPEEVLADPSGTDVSVAFDSGGVLRFIRTTDRATILENVASVFASQSFKDHQNFDYIDFRFGDKVYVKFK